MSTSSWGRELKFFRRGSGICRCLSTSSWGRELKCQVGEAIVWTIRRPLREVVSWNLKEDLGNISLEVDLFVRSWVEIYLSSEYAVGQNRRPLREVVSWNVNNCANPCSLIRRPLREVVSWNLNWLNCCIICIGRPLREVVSWNIYKGKAPLSGRWSTSSWGRELKYRRRHRKRCEP